MAEQLAFDWPVRVALGREDFFISEANARSFAMISAPEGWPEGKLAIVGPKGRIERVRVLGPARQYTQVEIAMTEQFMFCNPSI